MTSQQARTGKVAPVTHVTTNTGRILRVNPIETDDVTPAVAAAPRSTTGSHPVVVDPARRADVLFRVRRDEGHEISAWWMVGAFLVTSGLVILLLSGVPGVA